MDSLRESIKLINCAAYFNHGARCERRLLTVEYNAIQYINISVSMYNNLFVIYLGGLHLFTTVHS